MTRGDVALAELAQELNTDIGAAALVEEIGLPQDQALAAAFDTILTFAGSAASVSDLLDAIGLAEHPGTDALMLAGQAIAACPQARTGLRAAVYQRGRETRQRRPGH